MTTEPTRPVTDRPSAEDGAGEASQSNALYDAQISALVTQEMKTELINLRAEPRRVAGTTRSIRPSEADVIREALALGLALTPYRAQLERLAAQHDKDLREIVADACRLGLGLLAMKDGQGGPEIPRPRSSVA